MTRSDVLKEIAQSLVWRGLPVRNATLWGDAFDVHLLDGHTYRLRIDPKASPQRLYDTRGAAVAFFVEHHARRLVTLAKVAAADEHDDAADAEIEDRLEWCAKRFPGGF